MALFALAFLSAIVLVASRPDISCPPCNLRACYTPSCSAGQAFPGPCPCCPVCALDEGASCYNATIRSLKKPPGLIIPCGDNLDCILRHDLSARDTPEALCTCRDADPVCGSNDKTYDNMCQLRQEASKGHHRAPLVLKSTGPCRSLPMITSAPADTPGVLHRELALDCEAKGFPIPDIHWEFVSDNGGQVRNLPSDDLFVAVQVRGGPESFMATSWVQIVDLRPSDIGTYICVVSNSEGQARASARVSVQSQNKYQRVMQRY